jgi:hypothetical protein
MDTGMSALQFYISPTRRINPELNRLLTAAVINRNFCKLLLKDPANALANGYNGEYFHLANEEKDRLLSIRARSLDEFAKRLLED